ncbi:MAG: NUDIX domain-containing protein [Gemmatimonadaceae bacterium]
MTEIRAATVDVYVLRRRGSAWQLLLLQRASGTRSTGAWEVVHGHVDGDERPEEAALRELAEETGLPAERLYSVIVQPFYLHALGTGTITLAAVFAAVVAPGAQPTLSAEHQRAEWLAFDPAMARVSWPRSRDAIVHIEMLLRGGDAGVLEKTLRVR